MSISIAEARPPYVTFELQAVEDRMASIEAGHYVARDVPMAVITPQGSKDRIVRNAEEWFDHIASEAQNGRFPEVWLSGFRARFDAWKQNETLPEDGTPVVNWPAVSPAQIRALKQANVRTVEDLAVANEETLGRIGMGARALKSLAVNWLGSASSAGKTAARLTELEIANTALRDANSALQAQLTELLARLPSLPKPMK